MFKNSFKRVLKFILVMFFGFWFSTSASATIDETGALIDNNTFDSAYSLGYWQYHPSIICRLPADKKEAFFQFRINTINKTNSKTFYFIRKFFCWKYSTNIITIFISFCFTNFS